MQKFDVNICFHTCIFREFSSNKEEQGPQRMVVKQLEYQIIILLKIKAEDIHRAGIGR